MKDLTAMCANLPIQCKLYWVVLTSEARQGGEYNLLPPRVTIRSLWSELVMETLTNRCLWNPVSEATNETPECEDLSPSDLDLFSRTLDLYYFLVAAHDDGLLRSVPGYEGGVEMCHFEWMVAELQDRYDSISTGKAARDELANGENSEIV